MLEVILKAKEVAEFYGDDKKYFMRDRTINLQNTTAIFHTDKPEELPTKFKSKSFECSARIKTDQGKKAQSLLEAIKDLEEKLK